MAYPVASQDYGAQDHINGDASYDEKKAENVSETSSSSGFKGDAGASGNVFNRFIDSFKPAVIPEIDTTGMTDEEIQNARVAATPLAQSMPAFTLSLMAIGGSIGSGLFVGSGQSLADSGPGSVIIGFAVTGVMLLCMMLSLGECSVRFQISGSYTSLSIRLIDDSLGVACGWCYVLLWLVSYPLELSASGIILGYWSDDNNGATNVSKAAWVALFWVVLSSIGLSGAKTYASAEAAFSIIKIITIVGFCIFGIVITCGGGPSNHYFGGHYWHDPGSFANGFKGFSNTFVNCAFACSGIELAVLASSESKDPHKVLPSVVKQTFWRIMLFFIVSLSIAFCLVPYTNENLGVSSDGNASPFVLAVEAAGVNGLPSVINVVILLAALSVGNASIFACSRTITAIAQYGGAPSFLTYIDRAGRPLCSILVTIVFGLIGFIVASDKNGEAFDWMMALSSQATLFTWAIINLNHIMFRIAMKKQGRSLKEQYYVSPFGIWGSIFSFAIIMFILGLEMWTGIFPLGEDPSAGAFFEIWLSLPIVLAIFFAHKLWYRHAPVWPSQADLITGARIKSPEEILLSDEADDRLSSKPMLIRYCIKLYNFCC